MKQFFISVTTLLTLSGVLTLNALFAQFEMVYAYNDDPSDKFNNNAKGYIFQQLGLLDANGAPLNPIPPGQEIKDGGGNVIGYKNAAGTQAVYNLNATTAEVAWQATSNNGTLHIIKHGAWQEVDGAAQEGGGIQLDGGNTYDGFEGGTGSGYGAPYPLGNRPGANIKVILNSCWSSKDPDGPTGPGTSVTSSTSGEPGVGSVEGHNGKTYTGKGASVSGGTAAQRNKAAQAIAAAAPGGNVNDYIAGLPMESAQQTLQALVDAAVPPPGTLQAKINYWKGENPPGGGAPPAAGNGGHMCPVKITGSGMMNYFGENSELLSYLSVLPGTLATPAMFQANTLAGVPAPAPPGHIITSPIFRYEVETGGPVINLVEIGIKFSSWYAESMLLWYCEACGSWQNPPGFVQFDTVNSMAILHTQMLSTYAVFGPELPAVRKLANVDILDGQSYCYSATGTIFTAWNNTPFIVEQGGSATLISGGMIRMLPGSNFKDGSYVHASITLSGPFCNPVKSAGLLAGADSHSEPENPAPTFRNPEISVWPNPTSGLLTVDIPLSADASLIRLQLVNIWGTKLFSRDLPGSGRYEVSIESVPDGIYFLTVQSAGISRTLKVVKR